MELIDKSALVAWIRSRLHPVVVPCETNYDDWDRGADSERLNILSFIDTLEVKEVETWHLQEKENIYNELIRKKGGDIW